MSKVISLCDCDYSMCKTPETRKNVHVGNECYHPNNNHHKTTVGYEKNNKHKTDNIDPRLRYIKWGM